jgi:lipoyl(octanoyl) transferase
MRHRLRIIIDPPCSAAFNMAADLYLLERAAAEDAVFLRFYRWDPPAISLGCIQDPGATLDHGAMEKAGISWIKRPTGGRAILHWNDLTYSIAFPALRKEFGQTIHESYEVISGCLMAGLEHAGIRCESHGSSVEYAATRREIKLPCFLSPNRNEIMVNGKKLIGSAQKRTDRAVLQHGSLPIDGSFRRLPEFCRIEKAIRAAQIKSLAEKCACVREIDPGIEVQSLITHLITGFAATLGYETRISSWEEIGDLSEPFRTVYMNDFKGNTTKGMVKNVKGRFQ